MTDSALRAVVAELRKLIELDRQHSSRSWVVDYSVLRCKELGFCAFCGERPAVEGLWSTDDGCMDCYMSHEFGFPARLRPIH